MRLNRLNLVSIGLAVVAVACGLIGVGQLTWLLCIASFVCLFLATKKQMRALKAAPVEAAQLPASPERERIFEPLCNCPGCGEHALHLLGRRYQGGETAPGYLYVPANTSPDIWWPLDDYEENRTNCGGANYKVRNGRNCPRRTFMVIERECLSCGNEWTEKL